MPTIYLNPPPSMVELEGSGEAQISSDGLTGTRKARVLTTELTHAIGFLLGAVVVTVGSETVYQPQPWPGIPNLVVDSIRTKPHGRSGTSSWSNAVLPHARTILEINYKTVSWQKLTDDKEKPENEDYLIQEVNCTCDTIKLPVKVTDTNFSAETSTREITEWKRLPRVEFHATIPKVRTPNFPLILDLNGKINTKTIFGGAPGTVLFDGPRLNNAISSVNDSAWKFAMAFIYNRYGWNNTLHPETLKWVPAQAVDGGTTKMYEEADLTLLFPSKKTK